LQLHDDSKEGHDKVTLQAAAQKITFWICTGWVNMTSPRTQQLFTTFQSTNQI